MNCTTDIFQSLFNKMLTNKMLINKKQIDIPHNKFLQMYSNEPAVFVLKPTPVYLPLGSSLWKYERPSGVFIFNCTESSSFLQRCIIQQLLDKIHVGQKHPATAVSLQTQGIKSITVKMSKEWDSAYWKICREIKHWWTFHELTPLCTPLEEDLNTPPICSQRFSHKWSSEQGWSWWRTRGLRRTQKCLLEDTHRVSTV